MSAREPRHAAAATALTAASDRARSMPATAPARLDLAAAAVASLAGESRRLERLGLEWPLARLAREQRYWRFVHALCAIAAEAA